MRGSFDRPAMACLALLAVALGGCPAKESAVDANRRPFEGQQLKLLVVDDPAWAAAAERLHGEWRARTGADLEFVQCSIAELEDRQPLAADAIVYPAHAIGTLAQRQQIARVPQQVLDENQLAWSDVFELLRTREATWGSDVYALPLGSPTFVCYYRADLLARLNEKPPATWADYQRLAKLLDDRTKWGDDIPADSPWRGSREPLAKGWAGLTLLARAAAYAKHPDYFSTLFDLETMRPLIDTPPFTKALDELTEVARGEPNEHLASDPDEVRAAFWRGECGLAIAWPTAARVKESAALESRFEAGFSPLPGSAEVYNREARAWQPRTSHSVPLLSIAGRLGSVTSESSHAEAAFQLLIALSGPEWCAQVSASSSATTLFRQAHAKSPRDWVERAASPAAASDYARQTERTLSSQDSLSALPIPGRAEYLAALDEAVLSVVGKRANSADALAACAASWTNITARLGVERQREAYRQAAVKQ